MSIKVTWLGHACVKLEYKDKVILIDPFISGNPKFPGDDYKPNKIDLLLITHGHNDHFGDAITLGKEFKPTIPVIHEMSLYLISQGLENVVGMNFGGTFEYEGIKITMVPSSHSSGYNSNGDVLYLGNPGGYVIEFPDGNILYHCGDTGVSADMKIIADLFQPKIGMLAIGGHYTMDSIGAAYAAQLLGLKSIIPIHYGTFPILAGNPNDLTHALDGTGIAVHAINPGESVNFKPIKEDTTMFA